MSENSCVFCQIVEGKIPATKVYEDEKILAFLDIKPVQPGHLLVIPKKHFSCLVETPDELLSYLFIKSKWLMQVLQKALKADFVVLSVVGIEVPHFHIHLVPRYLNDGLANWWPTQKYPEGKAEQIVQQIKKYL